MSTNHKSMLCIRLSPPLGTAWRQTSVTGLPIGNLVAALLTLSTFAAYPLQAQQLPPAAARLSATVDGLEAADLVFIGRIQQTAARAATLVVETSLRGTQDGAQLMLLGPPGRTGRRLFLLTLSESGHARAYQGETSPWGRRRDWRGWPEIAAEKSLKLIPLTVLRAFLTAVRAAPARDPSSVLADGLARLLRKPDRALSRLIATRAYHAVRALALAQPAHLRSATASKGQPALLLKRLLASPDPLLRQLGLDLVLLARPSAQRETVVALAASTDTPTARMAIAALGALGLPETIGTLGRLALRRVPDHRSQAISALATLGRALPRGQRAAVLQALERVLRAGPSGRLGAPLLRAIRIVAAPAGLPLLGGFLGLDRQPPGGASLSYQAALGLTALTGLPIKPAADQPDQQTRRRRYAARWRHALRAVAGQLTRASWPAPDKALAKRIDHWILLLGHQRHAMRETAERMLAGIGLPAMASLRKAQRHPQAEVRLRARALLAAPRLADPRLLRAWIEQNKLEKQAAFRENLARYAR